MKPVHVTFEAKSTDDVKAKLQTLLDDLHGMGVLTMKGTVKEAKTITKPYNRNTFEVTVVFDEKGEWKGSPEGEWNKNPEGEWTE